MFIVLTSAMTGRFQSWYLIIALTKQAYEKDIWVVHQNPGYLVYIVYTGWNTTQLYKGVWYPKPL